jgi:single-strand DNA-binding protein
MIVLRKTPQEQQDGAQTSQRAPVDRNEVVLTGRLSAPPVLRTLRSGAQLTTFRLIVRRPADPVAGRKADVPADAVPVRRPVVDVVECAVWDEGIVRSLATATPGDRIAVHGALRRRFARSAAAGATSWFNVEVTAIDPLT